ncbi:MAG: ABC transporter substrate-binding protein [Eubacteriales bacterium]|nr:ABC transporter substrate-binding protein [Eubacteriales bacterium]
MKKKLLALLLAASMCVSLSACGGGSGDGGDDTAYRDELNIAVDVDAETYNPILTSNSTGSRVGELIFNGLIRLDEELVVQPALAESWDISEDGLTYTFHLRSGVKFHDGSDFTSADVKYTFDEIMDEENNAPYRSRYSSITNIECPDDETVVFTLNTTNSSMLAYMYLGIIPEGAMDDAAAFGTAPIGTGPYKVESYTLNSETVLTANEDYWEGTPGTETINVYVINDNSTRLASLESGDVDFVSSPLTASDLELVEDNEDLTMDIVPGLGFTYLGFNVEDPIIGDLAVRQAIAYMTDKQNISDVIYNGVDTPGKTPLLSSSWAYDDSLTDYEYSKEKAEAVLDEAGWVDSDGDGIRDKDGVKLAFTVSTHTDDTSRFQVVEYLQNQLKEIGMDVDVSVTEWASFSDAMIQHNLQVWVAGWLNQTDPDRMYDMFYTGGANNFGCYSDADVDAALDAGRISTVQDERAENYQFVAQTVTDKVWYATLVEQAFVSIYNSKMEGYTVYPSGSIYTLWQAKIAE